MISIEGKKNEIDETFKALKLRDEDMLELRDIAEIFKYSKQTLNTCIKTGSLNAMPKGTSINSTWVVQVRHLKEFLLSNYIKQTEHWSAKDNIVDHTN